MSEIRPDRHRWLLALVVITLLVRGGSLVVFRDRLLVDVDQYKQLAETLRSDHQLGRAGPAGVEPTAFRPPLYPILLALTSPTGTVSAWQVGLVHLLLGVASVLLVLKLAEGVTGSRCYGLAALLLAVDPILVYWSAHIMTETVATLLACLLLLVLQRSRGGRCPRMMMLAGGLVGLAILCRPTFLAFAGLAWLLVAVRRQWRALGLYSLAACLVIMPWLIRNSLVLGRPVPTTSHGGYTLLLGNNPHFYDYLRTAEWGSRWDPTDFDNHLSQNFHATDSGTSFWNNPRPGPARDELARDRFAYQLAQESIAAEPSMFAWSCLVRLGRLWSPFPHRLDDEEGTPRRLLRYLVASWYLLILGLAAWSCWQQRSDWRSDRWCWGLLLCLSFSIVHTFYWSNLRMRAPLMPVVALLVARLLAQRWQPETAGSQDEQAAD